MVARRGLAESAEASRQRTVRRSAWLLPDNGESLERLGRAGQCERAPRFHRAALLTNTQKPC